MWVDRVMRMWEHDPSHVARLLVGHDSRRYHPDATPCVRVRTMSEGAATG